MPVTFKIHQLPKTVKNTTERLELKEIQSDLEEDQTVHKENK